MNVVGITSDIKLPGFTLIEVVIVMVVSAIIVASAISFIHTLNKAGEDSLAEFERNRLIIDVYSNLRKEFNEADVVVETDIAELSFFKSNCPVRVIRFMDEDKIILSGKNIDTINISVTNLSIQKTGKNEFLVTSISFEALLGNLTYQMSLNKEYSNAVIYNEGNHYDNY